MDSRILYSAGLLLFGVQLLRLSRRSRSNTAFLLQHGGQIAAGSGTLGRLNIALRTSWLAASAAEVWLLGRTASLAVALGAVIVVAVAQSLRWLAMRELGRRWTLETVTIPGVPPVRTGPYRYLRHPNWLAVALEVPGIPLVHGAYLTAASFLALELLLLRRRARVESAALCDAAGDRREGSASSGPGAAICIIGAGAAGLAAARALQRSALRFEVLERSDTVGGLWAHRPDGPLYKNVHAVSPKRIQAFRGDPMPDAYPEFPHHSLMHEYLRRFADSHDLTRHIRVRADVRRLDKRDGTWHVTLADGSVREYRYVLIASGYHTLPRIPSYPGRFAGAILHSKDYDDPAILAGKRVLVVGAGQSAIDILNDAAVTARKVWHSTRRGFFSVPRYVFGRPAEALQESPIVGRLLLRHIPLHWVLRSLAFVASATLRFSGYGGRKRRVPAVDLGGGAILPTIDQRIYAHYANGDIHHKPEIRGFHGEDVEFLDGTREAIDVVIFATGYRPDYSFVERSQLNWPDGAPFPRLYRNIFHPFDDTLFMIGMVHPFGSHWPVFETQAELVASYILTRECGASSRFDARRAAHASGDPPERSLYGNLAAELLVLKPRYLAALVRDMKRLVTARRGRTALAPPAADLFEHPAPT